jgi:hypothetical protein
MGSYPVSYATRYRFPCTSFVILTIVGDGATVNLFLVHLPAQIYLLSTPWPGSFRNVPEVLSDVERTRPRTCWL